MLNDPNLLVQLATLKGQFGHITEVITKLQERVSLDKAVELVESFEISLEGHYAEKFAQVIQRNPDWETFRKIGNILQGKYQEQFDLSMTPADICKFKNAPIVSAEVERCFSYMNRLLSPQRQRLTTEHIRWHLVLMWNDALSIFEQ